MISNPTRAIKNPTRAKTIPPAAETQVALEIGKETENFGFRLPALEESVPEKPVRLRDDLATALQNEPTRETVKLQEVEELSLQQVTATEATSAPAARALLSLSTGLSPAVAKTLNRGEKRLRYPLTPLSKAPQATVKKAELSVHADSGHVAGNVALAPETTVRELLVAVFDQKGALVATTKELLPAKAEKVEIKPFVAPGASRYLLGLRPRFEREKSRLEIVGGYRGHERHVEVPAPPGVEIGVGDADFYQSNVHQDHFVRFSATLSKKLLKQPLGDPDLTLYGIVVDEKGALLSVASQPIKNKPDTHRYDLDFGLLPDGVGHEYKFVVTSAYRIVLTPDASFTVDSAKLESDGSLVLTPKLKEFPMADVLKKPELRDYTQVKLAPNVVKALKAKGLSEFVGLSVEASGRSERTLYTGFPAFVVTTVTVEKVDDVTFVG